MTGETTFREILVFRTCGLGDFILSAPAFAMLRERFPGARITLLTTHTSEKTMRNRVAAYAGGTKAAPWIELLRPHLIDDVILIDDALSLSDIAAARRTLRQRRYDLVVQMMDVGLPWRRRIKKLAYIAALLGPVRQIGWRRRGTIEKGRIPAIDPELGHHVHGPAQFMAELKPPVPYRDADVRFDLRPSASAQEWANAWVADHVGDGRRLAVIAPGALHVHKNWPLEKYAALARALLDRHGDLVIAISGSPPDAAKGGTLASVDPGRVFNLCGLTNIDQSTALFGHAAMVVGNDGGAMHMADAVGAPTISIVPGLEFPTSIEPWHNQKLAIRHPVDCAPCYSFTYCPKGHNRCMREIEVGTVLRNCESVL